MNQNINPIAPNPPYGESIDITNVRLGEIYRFGTGDMWPLTLGPNGVIYGAAGDNFATKEINTWSPMNFWSIRGNFDCLQLDVVNNLPVNPDIYCRGDNVDRNNGVKPAGLIYCNGKLYLCVENMNYGDLISFNRQHKINGWIVTSDDLGVTWRMATEQNHFTGRLASCHFLNAGYDTENIIDGYIWAYFPCGLDTDDSWWCNGDGMLLGRISPERITEKDSWEFYCGRNGKEVVFSKDVKDARSVFVYPHFCGENHVTYNRQIKKYILGNYAFYNPSDGSPRPYHNPPQREYVTQLSLYESDSPWGPWHCFLRDDNWLSGGYQPVCPPCWMKKDSMVMVGSGNGEDYCFITQKIEFDI